MKKILTYLSGIFIAILTACSDEIPEQKTVVQAKRAILAYMIANNNLDGDIQSNIKWMYQNLATCEDSCALLIYYKPSGSNASIKRPEILEYRTDGNGNINNHPALTAGGLTSKAVIEQAKRYPAIEGTATDPDIMEANLKTMTRMASAESYGLIFGSHASGWLPASGTIIGRSFGQDGSPANSINLPEFARTLESCFSRNLDFILFDACMMGTAEVCYQLRNATHYCIASVMETPRVGYPYHLFLNELYKDEIDFNEICDTVISYNQSHALWGTYAAIDCTQMEALAAAVSNELTLYRDKLADFNYRTVQQYGDGRYKYFTFDAGDFIKRLSGKESLSDELQQALNKVVIAKSCLEGPAYAYNSVEIDADRYCGIGMYFPDQGIDTNWDTYYRSAIAWYQSAGWKE